MELLVAPPEADAAAAKLVRDEAGVIFGEPHGESTCIRLETAMEATEGEGGTGVDFAKSNVFCRMSGRAVERRKKRLV